MVFRCNGQYEKLSRILWADADMETFRRFNDDPKFSELVQRLSGVAQLQAFFPETPFLKIPARKRKSAVVVYDLDLKRWHAASMAERYLTMDAKVGDLRENGDYKDCVEVKQPGVHVACYPIRINWSLGKKKLLLQFKQWLKDRPGNRYRGLEMRQTKLTEHLKSLGALRLLKLDLRLKELSEFTSVRLKDGAPLYKSDNGWYAARKRALQHMHEVFMSDVPAQVDVRFKKRRVPPNKWPDL
jgi:hypothetical protein